MKNSSKFTKRDVMMVQPQTQSPSRAPSDTKTEPHRNCDFSEEGRQR